MQKVISKGKEYFFEELELTYENSKIIDANIAKDNLLDFKRILDKNKCKFYLMYGTLLGAIRENAFIKHDIDIDVITFSENELLDSIGGLIENGFKVARVEKETKTYTFIRNDVYIDTYIVESMNGILGKKYIKLCGKIFPLKYLEKSEKIKFLNTEFLVPLNPKKVLKYLYGSNWKTPIPNKPGLWEPKYISLGIKILNNIVPNRVYKNIRKFYRKLTK